ncbi:unnamed protein product [Paramecium sonneborni]|uniref:Uncharacterized protein n=1 Tax=Paramecium sonneborni TaxID=65129 RepID=A0A8S1RW24_9CILI|nr:unnamed protein product [Paramecium sonneborni]
MCINIGLNVIRQNYTNANFFIQFLPKNDTNIYVIFDQYLKDQEAIYLSEIISLPSFSGLQFKVSKEGIPLNFTSLVEQKASKLNQSYQLIQSISIINYSFKFFVNIYLIGFNSYSLDILQNNYQANEDFYQQILLTSINIYINVSSLSVAYSIYPNMLIIGLSTYDTIYLFQYLPYSNSIINYLNNTFKEKFSGFFIEISQYYNFNSKQILTFNFTKSFTLNQKLLFNNIQFNSIQVIVNMQKLSSFLYINNINEVIILSIDQNSFPIPIALIQVNFTIKQINLVSSQLILSYLFNNESNPCFQVWNVQYLPRFYYVNDLYCVNFDNNITI